MLQSALIKEVRAYGEIQVRRKRKWLRRLQQFAYLLTHLREHAHFARIVAHSPLTGGRIASTKYLGNCLALSLTASERMKALDRHHSTVSNEFPLKATAQIQRGVKLWQKEVPGEPDLSLVLELAKLAPMEGELQLRFSFRSDLHVLTFLVGSGQVFDSEHRRVLFIGGIQGRVGCREEIRAASKHNGEIAPVAMLLLAAQVIAEEMDAELKAVSEADQISMSYSPSMVRFDYRAFWTQMGGSLDSRFYSLPWEAPQRPLSSIKLSHRSRTRRKREEKARIREHIRATFHDLLIGSQKKHQNAPFAATQT